MDTRPDLDAIRARCEAATPGPWARHGADVRAAQVAEGESDLLFAGRDGSASVRAQADRDAEFVAHAREDVVTLLDAVAHLTAAPAPRASGTLEGG